MKKITIEFEVSSTERLSNDAVARVFYPDEGAKIVITKGLNAIELSQAIHHEIGHVFDWYLGQSEDVDIREQNADVIGDALRYREST